VTTPSNRGWAAPYADSPVHADVTLPGSKSITNRAVLLAALATGPSTIRRPLAARDTSLMAQAMRELGVTVEESPTSWQVTPEELRGPAKVDCGLAGTVMRFVPPVAALATGWVAFDGDVAARRRPMSEILVALRALGVAVEPAAEGLPFWLHGEGRVRGGPVRLDASASSQFVSALLLAGARYDRGVDVRHEGKPVPSAPHIEMTVGMLRQRGVDVDDSDPNRWSVAPGEISPVPVDVEPDLSNAAPFLAAAVVTAGRVTVAGWPQATIQPGDRLRDIYGQFGAAVTVTDSGLTVTGAGRINGVDVDLHEVGELTPVVAAVAALASGPSYLRNIGHLRGHETDRLRALRRELGRLGASVTETADGLRIDPRPLTGDVVQTYGDHRMAQAAAVLGLAVPGIEVADIATTAKTHPDFVSAWQDMLK
jgi:3-phosphoshikimate 1-carboxyvinyltransferase